MAKADTPRRARVAAALIWLMALAGLLLVLDGLWELRWWGSSSTHHLLAAVHSVTNEFAVQPPALLRGHSGAWELVVLGLLTMLPATLARAVRRGSRTAATWVFLIASGTLTIGVISIGADSTDPSGPGTFLSALQGIAAERIPEIRAAMYPGWYQWVEDIAQGLQVLATASAVGALASAVIWHGDWFTRPRPAEAQDDAWDSAISRLHKRAVAGPASRG